MTDHTIDTDRYSDALAAVRTIIGFLGYDPDSPGLADTPRRFLGALAELTTPTDEPAALGKVQFPASTTHPINVGPIAFTSLCEHHLLPITGAAHITYLAQPDRVPGLSKLARLVDAHARGLTIQEGMTAAIADDAYNHLGLRAVHVHITARHACMSLRGPRAVDSAMSTIDERRDEDVPHGWHRGHADLGRLSVPDLSARTDRTDRAALADLVAHNIGR